MLTIIEPAIPRVETTSASCVPGSVSVTSNAIAAHGNLQFPIFPDRKDMYVPDKPSIE